MSSTTLFCTSPQLAEETGLDVRVVRDMCEKKIIPSEIYNGRYRILHGKAIKILIQRSEEFAKETRDQLSEVKLRSKKNVF